MARGEDLNSDARDGQQGADQRESHLRRPLDTRTPYPKHRPMIRSRGPRSTFSRTEHFGCASSTWTFRPAALRRVVAGLAGGRIRADVFGHYSFFRC